jgi:hypothetical protein
VDILGPLPTSSPKQYKYIIVFIDHFTSWAEAFPLRNIEAITCAEVLVNEIVLRYGLPKILLSDRGSQFLCTVAEEINTVLGIEKKSTTAYHPQTNGKVERFNNTLVNMLAMYVSMKQNNWDKFIPYARFAYNTSRHELNKFSPCFMLFGVEPEYLVDAMVRTDSDIYLTVGDWPRKVIRNIRRAHLLAERNQRVVTNKYLTASLAKPPPTYYPGELVLMKYVVPYRAGSEKFLDKWNGPYEVAEQLAPVTYRISLPAKTGTRSVSYILHSNRLKKYYPRKEEDVVEESEETREQVLQRARENKDRADALKAFADEVEQLQPKPQ